MTFTALIYIQPRREKYKLGIKVAKFGGSSLCDAEHFRRVKAIIESDPDYRYVVPSAPGKRFDADEKITDMLYQCHHMVERNRSHEEIFAKIAERYRQIARELELDFDVEELLLETSDAIRQYKNPDFAASRGEYLNGILLSKYLGWDFIDAQDVVKFDRQGSFASEWTNEVLGQALANHERAVIPGFYGSYPNGDVHTFSRGGSDITGAIAAAAVKAEIHIVVVGRIVVSHIPVRDVYHHVFVSDADGVPQMRAVVGLSADILRVEPGHGGHQIEQIGIDLAATLAVQDAVGRTVITWVVSVPVEFKMVADIIINRCFQGDGAVFVFTQHVFHGRLNKIERLFFVTAQRNAAGAYTGVVHAYAVPQMGVRHVDAHRAVAEFGVGDLVAVIECLKED